MGMFGSMNVSMRDTLIQPYPVSNIITIVGIDDASLKDYGRWSNWPRTLHMQLIEHLQRSGARVIVLDYLLTGGTPDDEQLARSYSKPVLSFNLS